MDAGGVERGGAEPTDAELMKQAAAGDAKAFGSLARRHSGRLFGLAYSLLGNRADAEDVLQEALIGAFRGVGGFEGRASVGTWLTRIVVTQVARWRRDRRGRASWSIDAESAPLVTRGGAGGVDAKLDLHAALGRLSPEHREVLVLRELEQMTYGEMAEVLGVPRGTIESRLFRARAELREKLKGYLP